MNHQATNPITPTDINHEIIMVLREAQVAPSLHDTRRLINGAIALLKAVIINPQA